MLFQTISLFLFERGSKDKKACENSQMQNLLNSEMNLSNGCHLDNPFPRESTLKICCPPVFFKVRMSNHSS
jgi:hypothetical protein